MTEAPKPHAKPKPSRDDRLKAALKANMGRRKAQARARAEVGEDNDTGAESPAEKE